MKIQFVFSQILEKEEVKMWKLQPLLLTLLVVTFCLFKIADAQPEDDESEKLEDDVDSEADQDLTEDKDGGDDDSWRRKSQVKSGNRGKTIGGTGWGQPSKEFGQRGRGGSRKGFQDRNQFDQGGWNGGRGGSKGGSRFDQGGWNGGRGGSKSGSRFDQGSWNGGRGGSQGGNSFNQGRWNEGGGGRRFDQQRGY